MGLFDLLFGRRATTSVTDSESDSIQFACQSCHKRLRVKATRVGKGIKCPACGISQTVPEKSSDDTSGERAAVPSYPQLHGEFVRAKGDLLKRIEILGRIGQAARTAEQKQPGPMIAVEPNRMWRDGERFPSLNSSR